MSTAPILSLDGVGKSFGGRSVAADISFSVEPGEVVCLLGASGSGKSTILRIVAGIERADLGTVHVGGVLVDGPNAFVPPEKRRVGLVFQDLALFPHLDARANAAFGLYRTPRAQALARADELLHTLGLAELAKAFPHQLSGGEQQRLAVARALAPQPRVMLLDEPFSGLDDRLRDGVRRDVIGLLRGQGAGTLFVTHDPDEALRTADRIVLIRRGRIVQIGTPADLLNRPADMEAAVFFSPVNSFTATIADGRAVTRVGAVPVAGFPEGAQVTVAFRSRDFAIRQDGAAFTVRTAMPASDGLHIDCEPSEAAPAGLVCVLDQTEPLTPGATVHLRARPGAGHVFAIA